MAFIHLNGKLLQEANAGISINNRSFRYGDGCFETIRIHNGQLPLWKYHWERLAAALAMLQFQLPGYFTAALLQKQILELAQKNGHQQLGRIRVTIFRGDGGLYDPENHFPNCLIQTWALNEASLDLNTNGLIIGIYRHGFKAADAFANIKSNNFLLYAMAALYAKEQYWNDALLLNHKGSIADATIANVFVIKDMQVITPPLSDGPVAGTMRRYLLQQLPTWNYTVTEGSLFPEDIQEADEVFLTNSMYGIKWVKQVDEKELGIYHTAQIREQLMNTLYGFK